MYTDIILQTMRVAEIDQARINERLMNEQLRIARMSRPSLTSRIGMMLISVGERLQRKPMPATAYHFRETSMAR